MATMAERLKPLPPIDLKVMHRFWSKIKRTDTCWLWTGCLSASGYGQIWIAGTTWYANRIAYYMEHKTDPGTLLVLHSCHTPACVNPSHLRLGTQQENMQDVVDANRKTWGSIVGRAILDESDIPIIRRLFADGARIADIARKYHITESAIACIVYRKSWRKVP